MTVTLDAPIDAAELEEMLAREPAGVVRPADPLLAILTTQAVPVYRPEDIAAYKAAMVTQAQRRGRLAREITLDVFAGAFIICLLSALARALVNLPYTGCVAALALGLLLASGAVQRFGRVKVAKWVPYTLECYSAPIPADATMLIERLSAVAPDVGFCVEEFQVNSVKLDPLLFALWEGQKYCIAAWDEPGLDAPLMH